MFSGRHRRARPRSPQRGFTLVELLVVMVIIGLLMAMLLTAVQRVRENARVTSCANNLKQIALAVASYEARHGYYPPSMKRCVADSNGRINGWSIQALLLPYVEQNQIFSQINFDRSLREAGQVQMADGKMMNLAALRVPTYLCPSERRDEPRLDKNGVPTNWPINYGVNLGVWFVYDPATDKGGEGAFYPFSKITAAEVSDGLSFTLCAAEVKGYNPHYRNADRTGDLPLPVPADIGEFGGSFYTTGHTEWVEGRAVQIGFTTTFAPNTKVLCNVDDVTYDVDWSNHMEGTSTTVPTYAAVTARSYHRDGINAAMLDGSVRWFGNDINLNVWRAFSTRRGDEIIPPKY